MFLLEQERYPSEDLQDGSVLRGVSTIDILGFLHNVIS